MTPAWRRSFSFSRRALCALAAGLSTLPGGGCRTELLESRGPIADLATNGTYSARMLPTDAARFAIFEQSEGADLCAWVIAAESRNSNFGFTAPLGWVVESASVNRWRADCGKLDPFTDGFWPAEGSGALTYDSVDSAKLPCAINVHGEITADLTVNMVPRPAGITQDVRFDVDHLAVVGACAH